MGRLFSFVYFERVFTLKFSYYDLLGVACTIPAKASLKTSKDAE